MKGRRQDVRLRSVVTLLIGRKGRLLISILGEDLGCGRPREKEPVSQCAWRLVRTMVFLQ